MFNRVGQRFGDYHLIRFLGLAYCDFPHNMTYFLKHKLAT
jgi:hypothetical protein